MVGSHLAISAVVTAAALAGCLAYLLSPPISSVAVDQQPHLGKLRCYGFKRPRLAAS
jgi:uncharacterized membrane protein